MKYEFKGTKEKWFISGSYLYALHVVNSITRSKFKAVFYPDWEIDECISELNYNIKLASKAPEMFEMLNKIFQTMDKGTERYIELEKLLKEATEL